MDRVPKQIPYDQRLAMPCVALLARTGVHPNHVTAFNLLLAIWAALLFASGDPVDAKWGAALFAGSRFLDHFDGELARITGRTSRFGYFFDYACGGLSYALLFLGLGVGLTETLLGPWSLALGLAGAAAALISMILNVRLDRGLALAEGKAVGYPGLGGFELEDGIYLIVPVVWLGWTLPFFTAAALGAAIYTLFTGLRLLALTKADPG